MISAKGIIVKEYLDKWGKEIGSLTLARKIYVENNLYFKDIEDTRRTIRYYRGKIGAENRKNISDEKYFT